MFILSVIGLAAFLVFTDPLQLPLPFLLMPFLLLFSSVRSFVVILSRKLYGTNANRRVRLLATGCALIVTFVIVLQSLGQLSWRDILLAGSLILAVAFYFTRTDLL